MVATPSMNHPSRIRTALAVAAASALFTTIVSAEKLDLSRVTPVPANEQVPAQDFFRPLLLQEPRLNQAGTHIAAIVTAGEDKHQLLV